MGAKSVRDLGRIPGLVLPAIEDHANLLVTAKGLNEMGIEIGLAPRDNDQPSLRGLGGLSLG
jgi:hypothetical protein